MVDSFWEPNFAKQKNKFFWEPNSIFLFSLIYQKSFFHFQKKRRMGICLSKFPCWSPKIPIDVPKFTIAGVHEAHITKVHDGDTWKAVFKFRGTYNLFTLRLDGLDTPEIHHSNVHHQRVGCAIRKYLKQFEGGRCKLHCRGIDKFGRILAVIVMKGQSLSVNQCLLQRGWANPYAGKTKLTFSKGMLDRIEGDLEQLYDQNLEAFFKLPSSKMFQRK